MRVFLHIGTEKTGSSYLQSIAANNRNILLQHGIWYPSGGKREKDMIAGRISPGNAQTLGDLLANKKQNRLYALLKNWVEEALENNCNDLLLSNELLAMVLCKPGAWVMFNNTVKMTGISEVKYLLILRDPVDLVLSLYKHRAKYGKCSEIEDWVVNDFEYGRGLGEFFQIVEQIKPDIIYRKYKSIDGYLAQVFFYDWLYVKVPLKLPEGKVNHSLNLSELLLIKSLANYHSFLPKLLYEKLMKVHKKDKAPENKLEMYYRHVISREIIKYIDTWKKCQMVLPSNEDLELPDYSQANDNANKVLSLSSFQIDMANSLIVETMSLKFYWKILKVKMRYYLSKIKHKFLALFSEKE